MITLAAGEHLYGRGQTLEPVDSRIFDALENDPDWTGGINGQHLMGWFAWAATVP